MKLLVQRVTRATVEVDGFVESRIGSGLVLYLALRKGDTVEKAQRLATRIVKLNLWHDMSDPEKKWCTSVVDNGFELLVLLQQTLCATFQKLTPNDSSAMAAADAKVVYEAFIKTLQKDYQEEMVVPTPLDTELRIELTDDGPCVFEIDPDESSSSIAKQPLAKTAVNSYTDEGALEPDLLSMSRALQRLALMPKSKAFLESVRIFRVFSQKRFRTLLAEAVQAETDAFAESLESAARFFSQKQLEQIMNWTGLTITSTGTPGDDFEEPDPEDDLLAERLAAEAEAEAAAAAAAKPAFGKRRMPMVKEEFYEDTMAAPTGRLGQVGMARTRPDWKGRAAPDTPAAASARQWAANRAKTAHPSWTPSFEQGRRGGIGAGVPQWGKAAGKGKGGGRGWRSYGIASLDEVSRIHGTSTGGYQYGQLQRYGDEELNLQAKQELSEEGEPMGQKRAAPALGGPSAKLPKGTPTVAPMTPAPQDSTDDL